MTTQLTGNESRVRRAGRLPLLGAVAMIVGLTGFSAVCRAAEPLPPARAGGVPATLASVTVLSEAAMARQTAAGIPPAQIIGDQTGRARVMLWDELKTLPELPPGANGSVTLTTGGGK